MNIKLTMEQYTHCQL